MAESCRYIPGLRSRLSLSLSTFERKIRFDLRNAIVCERVRETRARWGRAGGEVGTITKPIGLDDRLAPRWITRFQFLSASLSTGAPPEGIF